jgi:hypothetical protein
VVTSDGANRARCCSSKGATRGCALPTLIPKATGWMSRSFGFAASRTRRRGSAANAGVHGVAPPTGRAAGYARSERRWSTGFGPEIVGVSTGWAPLQTLADGAAHGAVVAAAESLGRAGATSRGHSCPLGRRTRARVPSERSAGPGGLRSNGAGRRRRAASWSTVPSRASGGNTASASILFVESVSHGSVVDSSVEGSRLASCRAPRSSAWRGFAPNVSAVAVRGVSESCGGSHRGWQHLRRSARLPRPIVRTEHL